MTTKTNLLEGKNKQPKYIKCTNVDKKDSNGLTLFLKES